MKIFILPLMLFASVVFAADYGGADRYPVQTKTGGSYIVSAGGVAVSPTYDLQARAESAASALSLKCGCVVTVTQPILTYNTEWRKSATSSSSSKSSSSATSSSRVATSGYIEWERPTKREDGSSLDKVLAYHIIFEEKSFLVSGDKTKLALNKPIGTALIAAQDSTGVMSNYVQANVKAVF